MRLDVAVKAVGHELMETGHRAAARGDQAMAQACAAQLGRLGQSLTQPQYTPMAQLVGKALVKMGAAPSPR